MAWCAAAAAADWPCWGGTDGRNMVASETGLPDSFVPGQKDPLGTGIKLSTTKNVKWVARLGSTTCSTPAVARGRVFIGTASDGQGMLLCLDEATGRRPWQWSAPVRKVPAMIEGRKFWFHRFPGTLGVCSSPAVDADRVYFVTHRLEVLCLDFQGRTVWTRDMWDMGVRPSDACNGSVLVAGDLLYVCTSNGVDRDADAKKRDEHRRPPAPLDPSLIVLAKRTGRVVATDDAGIGPRLLHGQWSSPSMGRVGDRALVFFGGGDGFCYAFEALAGVGETPTSLKTAWRCDCDPPEYRAAAAANPILHYCRGDRRRADTLNTPNDGSFVGMSEIIATPVFDRGRVYVAIGRDPEHGRGRGALWCIDAAKTGDVTASGRVWCYQGLDRSLSTVSIADGLVYAVDVAGRLHCLDAATGRCCWIHESQATVWGSTLVADGKVYLPTQKHFWILAAGRHLRVLAKISLGSAAWATPVAANGVLYVASQQYLWAVRR